MQGLQRDSCTEWKVVLNDLSRWLSILDPLLTCLVSILFGVRLEWKVQASTYGFILHLFRKLVKFILSSMSILGTHSCWVGNSDPAEEKGDPAVSQIHHPLVLARSLSPCN